MTNGLTKSSVHPELPTAALRSSQTTHAVVDNSAPSAIGPESTYKSGKAVQTNGATSQSAFNNTPGVLLLKCPLDGEAYALMRRRSPLYFSPVFFVPACLRGSPLFKTALA